jgi:hypothetical protein
MLRVCPADWAGSSEHLHFFPWFSAVSSHSPIESDEVEEVQGRLWLARRREEHFYLEWVKAKRERW